LAPIMAAETRGLGARVAARRRALGLTQEELAERANVNLKTVQGLEQGRTEPELRSMRQIARVLDTTIDALVDGGQMVSSTAPRDALLGKVEADLRRCSPRVLKHVAAIVGELARRSR
jgi:transcriptional regulator with XRE-family HTH domain